PQVMLVTLQKESGLLSRTNTTAASYNAAWGWHCPDTGPGGTANCDPAYAGFFNQGYGMAKQWARYKVNPEKYNYRAGQTVNILWNVVESGCGGAPVTIKNTATASLYNYTPYQPNAASLAAYPGVGDACSAYGNRNFFFLFRKYFGSTGGGSSTTIVNPAVLATGTTVKVPANQYVSGALAGQTITAPTPQVAAGLAAGFSALGLPYVWGGGGSGAGPTNGCPRGGGSYNSCGTEIGFDCSGLTAYVLGMAGYQTPGDSGSQRSAGVSVSWDQAQPGDIVGFPGHVAVYLGTFGGRPYILEASWVGTPVHIVPLTRTDMDDRVHRYWTGVPVRATGVADFGSIVRTYSYMSPSYTPSLRNVISGASGGGSTGYRPNIPRIRPVPYPAPAPVVTIPVPAPATPTPDAPPATTTVEQPPPAPPPASPATTPPADPTSTTAPPTSSAAEPTPSPTSTSSTTSPSPVGTSPAGSTASSDPTATATPTPTATATPTTGASSSGPSPSTSSSTATTTGADPASTTDSASAPESSTPAAGESPAATTEPAGATTEPAAATTESAPASDTESSAAVVSTGEPEEPAEAVTSDDSSDDSAPADAPDEPITPVSCADQSAVLTAKNGFATAVDGTPLPDCDVPDEG
ncbi:MAG TPA: NlpC/P60 family protein, partial [Nakamurella sp.]